MTKIGTLKELGVNPGDVVEYHQGYIGMYPELVGHKYTVDGNGKPIHCSDDGKSFSAYCDHKFRLISRATPAQKLWRDMTPEEKAALLLAHHEGKVIEARLDDGRWLDLKFPHWIENRAYRIKTERTKSEWSEWLTSKADGTTKLNLSECAEVERVALGDSKQFAYRVKKWVE